MQEWKKGQRAYFKDKNGIYHEVTIKSIKDGYANIDRGSIYGTQKVKIEKLINELPEEAKKEKLKLDKEIESMQEALWRAKDGIKNEKKIVSDIREVFIKELSECKNDVVDKTDIIRLGEEFGMVINKREAKAKVVKAIAENHFDRLYDTFQEFIYIPSWTVADYYKMNTDQVDKLHELGVIKEDVKEKEFYNRSHRGGFTANTYPISVLDNYTKEELQQAYNLAYGQKGYRLRLETKTEEEVQDLINEFEKVFRVTKSIDTYEKRNEGYHSYFTIEMLNNSKYEENRLLAEIKQLKAKLKEVETENNERVQRIKDSYHNVFDVNNLFELEKIKREFDELKANAPKHNQRNAGRKSSVSDEGKAKIKELRDQGKTIKQISEEMGYSVGTIHKLINENK